MESQLSLESKLTSKLLQTLIITFMIDRFTHNNFPEKEFFMNFSMQAISLQSTYGTYLENLEQEVSFYLFQEV